MIPATDPSLLVTTSFLSAFPHQRDHMVERVVAADRYCILHHVLHRARSGRNKGGFHQIGFGDDPGHRPVLHHRHTADVFFHKCLAAIFRSRVSGAATTGPGVAYCGHRDLVGRAPPPCGSLLPEPVADIFFREDPGQFSRIHDKTREILCRTIRFRAWAPCLSEKRQRPGHSSHRVRQGHWLAWPLLLGKRPHEVEFGHEADQARILNHRQGPDIPFQHLPRRLIDRGFPGRW